MLFNLANGNTIEISLEHFLSLTDEDLEQLNASNFGTPIENPFYSSALGNHRSHTIDDPDPITEDLTELSSEDKLLDLDLDGQALEE